jgi:hypothetical protein
VQLGGTAPIRREAWHRGALAFDEVPVANGGGLKDPSPAAVSSEDQR